MIFFFCNNVEVFTLTLIIFFFFAKQKLLNICVNYKTWYHQSEKRDYTFNNKHTWSTIRLLILDNYEIAAC